MATYALVVEITIEADDIDEAIEQFQRDLHGGYAIEIMDHEQIDPPIPMVNPRTRT